jgi:hypothetical protein
MSRATDGAGGDDRGRAGLGDVVDVDGARGQRALAHHFYDRAAAGSTPAKRSMQIQSSGGRVQALLLDASTDMLWIMNRVGFTWQVLQVSRSAMGLVMPPASPLVVAAGAKLARCN